jgi:hypothetical protein
MVPFRIVPVGRERLRQILATQRITFQRTRTWKESTDPDFEAKLDRIEQVTSRFPDRCCAFDQFGPLSIRPHQGTTWAPAAHPDRFAGDLPTHPTASATSTAVTAWATTSCGVCCAAARAVITPWPR